MGQVPELANDIFFDLDDLAVGEKWAEALHRGSNRVRTLRMQSDYPDRSA